MTEPADSSDIFSDKLAAMNTQLNSLTFRTKQLPSRVNQLDDNINEISTRISNIRNNRYYSQANLEKMAEGLFETWNTVSPNIKSSSNVQINAIQQRQNDFETKISQSNSMRDLEKYTYQLSDLSRDVNNVENIIQARLNNYQNDYNIINNELKTAEETISNLSNTSINWKNNEHPILAVKTHDLTNDKHGILTLTNLRILFEEVKEVVIRKKLFFATEKKTIKEVVLNQPIGSIDEIEKGRVGFFKGAGLFFKFKSQTGLDELKIDTSRNEDEKIIHFYNYIISGEAEKELAPNQEETDHGAPIKCPNCSAPYGEEILKGQTSVKCIYCGTVIML
jgi:DNA-directed RNA polymerase subunit RPC12/RpoP